MITMVDFHSHLLPSVDDGSRSVEESLQLLDMLRDQHVSTVVATPHFYANEQSVHKFLQRRQKAYEELVQQRQPDHPHIRLGAEVRYYPGISHLDDLRSLCLEGTRLLLLEMPMTRWTDYTVKELMDIVNARGVTLVLAHIERYRQLQDIRLFERLLQAGVLMQVNATFFTERWTRHRALKMLGNQMIHFIGSDCHGIRVRPPYMGEAMGIIGKKFGDEFLSQMNEFATELISV